MATVTPIKNPEVAATLVLCDLSKARSLAWTLAELANGALVFLPGDPPDETREWLCEVVNDALRATLDRIEAEFKQYAEKAKVA